MNTKRPVAGTPPGEVDENVAEEVSETLGRLLRDEYGNLLRQPVPDQFHDLLEKLAEKPPVGTSEDDDEDNGQEPKGGCA